MDVESLSACPHGATGAQRQSCPKCTLLGAFNLPTVSTAKSSRSIPVVKPPTPLISSNSNGKIKLDQNEVTAANTEEMRVARFEEKPDMSDLSEDDWTEEATGCPEDFNDSDGDTTAVEAEEDGSFANGKFYFPPAVSLDVKSNGYKDKVKSEQHYHHHSRLQSLLSADVGDDVKFLSQLSPGSLAATVSKESWLLRLFESKLFNMSHAVQYLFNSKEQGVLTYLGE